MVIDQDSRLALTVLLDMATVLCNCDATNCLPTSTSTLLAKLVKDLSSRTTSADIEIRVSLLNCLAAAKKSGSSANRSPGSSGTDLTLPKSCTDDAIFNLALSIRVRGTHLKLASAFASYAVISIKKSTDGLLVAETWDYLCDALMFAAANQHITQLSALDIVDAVEQICEGLAALLTRADTTMSERCFLIFIVILRYGNDN